MGMLADAALRSADYAAAYQLCMDLVDTTRTAITTDRTRGRDAQDVCWRVCYEVGKQDGWRHLERRLTLIGFTLAMCPCEQTAGILNLWRRLDTAHRDALQQSETDKLRYKSSDKDVLAGDADMSLPGLTSTRDRFKSLFGGWLGV
jgi:hypothetical protein